MKRAKTRMVGDHIHHPIRPKPIARIQRPPRPIAIAPTATEVSQAKRYKKAEEEVLGVAPDAEAKPKGRGTKKEPNPSKGYGSMVKPKTVKDPAKSKGYGSKVKKEQIKSPATVFKRVKAKKAENSAPPDPEPDTEVNPKSSKGKSSKPKPIVKGKGFGAQVQKQQVKEPTAVFRRKRIRVKTPPDEVAASSSSSDPPPPPAPPPPVKVGKGKGGGVAGRKAKDTFEKKYETPIKKSKNYIELENLLRSLNTRAKGEGLSTAQVAGFKTLMEMIRKSGPDTVNKALIKRALDTYNKSDLGIKSNAKAMKA